MKLKSPEFRILFGAIGFINGLLVLDLSGLPNYNPDPTIASAMIAFSSVLMGVGIIKKFSKNNQNNETNDL
jgi:hypothetical protein